MFAFQSIHRERHSRARCGVVRTPHGAIDTPAFMPVGTKGTVKGLTPDQVAGTHTQMILANTYHLWLRPGPQLIAKAGGLHDFVGWGKPILTDSGGFQVFSLADLATISDQGITFRSHIDGTRLFLDPQVAIEIQNALGADIIMALDQCTPYPCERAEVERAVARTLDWAQQCKQHHRRADQALFGIVQGGVHEDLRTRCAEALCEIGFPGYAIGGLSVGEPHQAMLDVLHGLADRLPADRPRYLMGMGMPRDIVKAVEYGVDMFDCVLPTRNGRNAYAFTAQGPIKLRNEQHKTAEEPIERDCLCYSCTHFSRSYIRHLFIVEEMLGPILTSLHNIYFFQRLMIRIRQLIQADNLTQIYEDFPVAR